MPFNFNGNTPNSITWNGNTVNKLLYNGTEVWSNTPATFTGLCFTANTANSTVELTASGSPSISDTAYSTDGTTWTSFTPSTRGTNIVTLTNIGDKVYFRNNINGEFGGNYLNFKMSGSIAASGNVNSLYDAENFESLTTLTWKHCYYMLFSWCEALTSAPALPATTLSWGCYRQMFSNCTGLTTAPALPATTLNTICYSNMFEGCTALVSAPELPATTLTEGCYSNMFEGCTALVSAPELPATTLASQCYYAMFKNCTSLTSTPVLPATTIDSQCYLYMFQGCTSLTTVSELPATTLKTWCYSQMFNGCTSLQVSDTQTAAAPYAWTIPTTGTFTNTTTYDQEMMFYYCAGTRSSYDMSGGLGESHTYYTQNPPVAQERT